MPDPVTIVLLGEPVPFARSGHRGAQHYTPSRQRNTAAALKILAQQEMNGRPLFEEPVSLEMLAEMAIPKSWSKRNQAAALLGEIRPGKKPDWDNLGKLCADALNGVVYRDDALVVDGRVRKIYGNQPKIVITVRQISFIATGGEAP